MSYLIRHYITFYEMLLYPFPFRTYQKTPTNPLAPGKTNVLAISPEGCESVVLHCEGRMNGF